MAKTGDKGPSPHFLKHLRIDKFQSRESYSRPRRDMSGNSSWRNRDVHGPALESALAEAFSKAHALLSQRDPQIQSGIEGIYLEVQSAEGRKLPDLNWKSKGIRAGATRLVEDSEVGALFVPASAEAFLAEKVRQYAHDNTPKNEPKNEDKFAPVEQIRAATVETLWTDQRPLPTDEGQNIWWECWCWQDRLKNLINTAQRLNLHVSNQRLVFPDLEVVPVYGTISNIRRLLQNTDAIEELRRATDSPSFFTSNLRREQSLWVDDLKSRVTPPDEMAPAVCILDNGVARAHPLIEMALSPLDCHTIDPEWGVDDHDGHGTNMAGTALYSDLTYPMADSRRAFLAIRLESVKFLPPPGVHPNDPQGYGSITQAAIALPEISQPDRARAYCMAITNDDVSGERPTSWSAAIDQACAGVMPGDDSASNDHRRLIIVSAGNIPDASNPDDISDPDEFPIEDPAQAWNAIAVGGTTEKSDIAAEDNLPNWTAVAEVGDRSPYSRISSEWDHSRNPIKPEVVFEAGNKAINAAGTEILSGVDSLSLLTTNADFLTHPLETFWATSPATAQASGMAANVMAEYPDYWPETIRALLVHSAVWTPTMKKQLDARAAKKDRIALARAFGYGVPILERALASAQNDIALIAQAYLQPFVRKRVVKDGKSVLGAPTFNDVHYYDLPWPKAALEGLGGANVRLKITLSYFIEPSPSQNAPVTPSRYQSHGLRFDLKRPKETEQDFHKRINQLEREDGDTKRSTVDSDSGWTFGSQSVAAGSLHCDVWEGPAVDLAARDKIAIYPVSGWWRYSTSLKRYNSRTRYCLIVSIFSDDEAVELYTEIAQAIGLPTETTIAVS